MGKIIKSISGLIQSIRREKLVNIFVIVFLTVVLGAALVYVSEITANSTAFSNFGDSIWWAVVTVTSVGYGDIVPKMPIGRIIAGILMFFGITLISILSGTVASIIVDRKMREGRGLEEVKMKNHTVICGWNQNVVSLLDEYSGKRGMKKREIVLVNEMNPEDFQSIAAKYPDMEIAFIRGDFVNENILSKAGIGTAKHAILFADTGRKPEQGNPDERTILAALAVNALNSEVFVSAELVNQSNEQHLRRAHVDNIIVSGEFNAFLFSTGVRESGIPALVKEILSNKSAHPLRQIEVPAGFIGKTFSELSEHMIKSGKGILIGFISNEKKMTLEDILSDDSSAIDDFIKKKFMEAEIDIAEEQQSDMEIRLSPGPEYVIRQTDSAFVIGNL